MELGQRWDGQGMNTKRYRFYQKTKKKWPKLQNSLYPFLYQVHVEECHAVTMYLYWEPVLFVKLVIKAV